MILSGSELKAIFDSPEALTALIDHHSQQETMADGMDYAESAEFHKRRREAFEQLRTEAESRRAGRQR